MPNCEIMYLNYFEVIQVWNRQIKENYSRKIATF